MKYFLVLFLSFLLYQNLYSTSCRGTISFCTLQKDSSQAVLGGVIVGKSSNYISFKIFDAYRGANQGDTIIVWDHYYSWATLGTDTIKANEIGNMGDSLLILLPIIDSAYADTAIGNVGDFLAPLIFCSQAFLFISHGTLYGNITTNDPGNIPPPPVPIPPKIIDTLKYQDFVYSWNTSRNNDSLCHKIKVLLSINKTVPNQKKLKVYPNPVQETLYLKSTTQEKLSFQLYNLQGQLVTLSNATLSNVEVGDKGRHAYQFSLAHLPSGIYFLKASDGIKESSFKIVKQ